jgi:DNA primase
MTSEEIKAQYSMRDIIEGRYGIKVNRAGMARCPFHQGDNTASLKVYKRDYHCFGCNANGDIFSFVQDMEHCDFKTAFMMLGGEYEKPSLSSSLNVYKARRARETKLAKEQRLRQKMSINNLLISVYTRWLNRFEPLSDEWCDTYNALQYQLYIFDELRGTKNA